MIHIISSLRNKEKGIPLPVTNISDLQKIPSKDGIFQRKLRQPCLQGVPAQCQDPLWCGVACLQIIFHD